MAIGHLFIQPGIKESRNPRHPLKNRFWRRTPKNLLDRIVKVFPPRHRHTDHLKKNLDGQGSCVLRIEVAASLRKERIDSVPSHLPEII